MGRIPHTCNAAVSADLLITAVSNTDHRRRGLIHLRRTETAAHADSEGGHHQNEWLVRLRGERESESPTTPHEFQWIQDGSGSRSTESVPSFGTVFKPRHEPSGMVVVVLGNRLRSADIHRHLRGRVELGISLARERDNEAIVMTGGRTNPDVDTTESAVMREYAVERGVDPSNIVVEPRRKDTIGNAYFSRRAIERRLDPSRVRLATSCYHVARAVYIFEYCFGDGYDVSAPDCYDSNVPTEELDEDESISLNRQFFAPVEPGDLVAVRDRMIDVHDLYTASDFSDELDA